MARKSTVNCLEHVQRISINVQIDGLLIIDSFDWDLSNPDNSPEEFAAELVADHLLQAGQISRSFKQLTELEKAVALEIRKKLDLSCLTHAIRLKQKIEALNSEVMDPNQNEILKGIGD